MVDDVDRPCDVYDIARLRRTGALALSVDEAGALQIVTARDVTGARLWNTPSIQRARRP
jgi:competence protein ComEC